MSITAIIVAAGKGARMGTSIPKQFLTLAKKPVLFYTLHVFDSMPEIDEILLVTAEESISYCAKEIVERYGIQKVSAILAGGETRQESVFYGLQAVGKETELVLVHDGVRPFVKQEEIRKTIALAKKQGGCILGVPVKDTIKVVNQDGLVAATPNRQKLYTIQTPQTFQYPLLLQAYQRAQREGFLGTDDASIMEWNKMPVAVCPGSYENIKLTTPEDLWLGEMILQRRGEGF